MHQILVYGDSLSWGIIPGTRRRLEFTERWPGVLELALLGRGQNVRVIEDCLNGRRTMWDDPLKPGRNGRSGLEQRIEINSPLSLVMLFLGTNDFQSIHHANARQSAQGIRSLVNAIRQAPIEPGMRYPRIIVIAPPPIQSAKGEMADKFLDAARKAVGLPAALASVALETQCEFFDAGKIITTSKIDGVHLDQDQHLKLGTALAPIVANVLNCEDA